MVEHRQLRLGEPVEGLIGCGGRARPWVRAGTVGNDGLAAASTNSSTALAGLGVRQRHRRPAGMDALQRAFGRPDQALGLEARIRPSEAEVDDGLDRAAHPRLGDHGRKAEPGGSPRPPPRAAQGEGLVARRRRFGVRHGLTGHRPRLDHERDAVRHGRRGAGARPARGGCAPRPADGCRASTHSRGARSFHRSVLPSGSAPTVSR